MSQPPANSPPILSESNLSEWLAYIKPSKSESAFNQVGFFTTMWEAVLESNRLEKPILLWAMNGHPMACT
jgi:hypothetical protein